MPEGEGLQTINFVVLCQWKKIGSNEIKGPYNIWSGSIQTQVSKPFIQLGTLDLCVFITGLSGTTLIGIGGFLFSAMKEKPKNRRGRRRG
jgi:hypothetical protein